jgi:hypothetical protein
MRAASVMWAVHGSALRFLAAARPGDGALPNSNMRGRAGRDPLCSDDKKFKMIELLDWRNIVHTPPLALLKAERREKVYIRLDTVPTASDQGLRYLVFALHNISPYRGE